MMDIVPENEGLNPGYINAVMRLSEELDPHSVNMLPKDEVA
jgi:hypothetical protein